MTTKRWRVRLQVNPKVSSGGPHDASMDVFVEAYNPEEAAWLAQLLHHAGSKAILFPNHADANPKEVHWEAVRVVIVTCVWDTESSIQDMPQKLDYAAMEKIGWMPKLGDSK